MIKGETDLRPFLMTLDPTARDDLCRVLTRDHADRDAIASRRCDTATRTGTLGGRA
jgi:hypothetical protein